MEMNIFFVDLLKIFDKHMFCNYSTDLFKIAHVKMYRSKKKRKKKKRNNYLDRFLKNVIFFLGGGGKVNCKTSW